MPRLICGGRTNGGARASSAGRTLVGPAIFRHLAGVGSALPYTADGVGTIGHITDTVDGNLFPEARWAPGPVAPALSSGEGGHLA